MSDEEQPGQLGDPFQSFQSFWQQHRIRSINRRDRQGREHLAVVVNNGDDFFATLVFVAGVANAITALLGHRIGTIAV
jgi:hypothetical protein